MKEMTDAEIEGLNSGVSAGDDEDILNRCDNYFREWDQYRKEFEPAWEEEERYYDGKHWKENDARPVKNFMFSTVETSVPILTDSRPGIDVIAHEMEPESEKRAKILGDAVQWVQDDQLLEMRLTQEVRSALITGNGYFYIDYDSDLQGGEGAITVRGLNWRNVWLDGSGSEVDEGQGACFKFPVRIGDVARRFRLDPSQIPAVSPDFLSSTNPLSSTNSGTRWTPPQGADNPDRYTGDDMTVLEEFWLKDYTMEDIDPMDTTAEIEKEAEQILNGVNPDVHKHEHHADHIRFHEELKPLAVANILGIPVEQVTPEIMEQTRMDSEEIQLIFTIIDDHVSSHKALLEINPENQKPKYPGNLRLVMKINRFKLYDGPIPVEADMIIPIVPIYCYKKSNCIYAFGEIRQILSIQKSHNEMDFKEYLSLLRNANAGWMKDDNSNVADESLTNDEGIVITKRPGTEVKRIDPGTVSPQLANRKQDDQFAIQRVSGVQEATAGERPKGLVAASAIKAVISQSVGRIRLKSRMLECYTMPRLGLLIANRIVKYWSVERKLRLWDARGKIKHVDYRPDDMEGFRYDVKIVPSTTAGIDKEAVYALYMELVTKQMISPRIFFSVTDLPYKNRVLEMLEEEDKIKMVLQQLQAENAQLKAVLQQVMPPEQEGPGAMPGQGPGNQAPPAPGNLRRIAPQ